MKDKGRIPATERTKSFVLDLKSLILLQELDERHKMKDKGRIP